MQAKKVIIKAFNFYKIKKLFYIQKIQLNSTSINGSEFLHLSTIDHNRPSRKSSFKKRSFKEQKIRLQFLIQNGLEQSNDMSCI
jgi:hypothetical protein